MGEWSNRGKKFLAAGTNKKQFPANSNATVLRRRSPLRFFLLVFALSIPFWLIGGMTHLQLLPGLPVSSLMVVCPLIAASILVYRENKAWGLMNLLKRSFDCRRIKAKLWYAPIFLLMPAVTVSTYGLMRSTGMRPSTPRFPAPAALLILLAFFVAALAEELGWMGYAIDPMQERWSALQASILLGIVWAAWHVVPLAQSRRSAGWIAWWCLFTVATRVLIVWIYNNTRRSIFAAILYHTMGNVCTVLFSGYFAPRITGLIVALVAATVTIIWGPRTLARYRNA